MPTMRRKLCCQCWSLRWCESRPVFATLARLSTYCMPIACDTRDTFGAIERFAHPQPWSKEMRQSRRRLACSRQQLCRSRQRLGQSRQRLRLSRRRLGVSVVHILPDATCSCWLKSGAQINTFSPPACAWRSKSTGLCHQVLAGVTIGSAHRPLRARNIKRNRGCIFANVVHTSVHLRNGALVLLL